MTATLTLAPPLGATSSAGMFGPLVSLWRRLRDLVAGSKATEEELQLHHLIEYALFKLGSPVLEARDVDALDDQLDDLVTSTDAHLIFALFASVAPTLVAREPTSSAAFLAALEARAGAECRERIAEAGAMLEAWAQGIRQFAAATRPEDLLKGIEDFRILDPEIPAEIAEACTSAMRATICLLAIVRILAFEEIAPGWLLRALIERLARDARAYVRFLASVPEVEMSETIVPLSERLDLKGISERHQKARASAQRALDDERRRRAR